MSSSPFPFVGFGTFERMLADLEPGVDVVYVNAIEDPVPLGVAGSLGSLNVMIESAAVLPDRVLYCRIPLGAVMTANGSPFEDAKLTEARARAEAAQAILLQLLDDRGFRHSAGVVAFPREHRLLNGWADCLHFDPATRQICKANIVEERAARAAAADVARGGR